MRVPGNEHDWFRRRLPDHLLDLLVEGDRRRFDGHARACEACARMRARAEGARSDWWDGAAHPPVAVLLDWETAPDGAATPDAVRAHLAHCEDCRRDLEELRGPVAARGLAIAPAPAPSPVRRPRPWLLPWRGLAATAAAFAAVAVLLVALPRVTEREPAPAAPGGPAPETSLAREPAPPAPPAAAAPRAVPEPVTIAAAERGAAAAATPVPVGPGVEHVPLTLPALFVPDGVMMEVALHDSAGATVTQQVLAAERALRPGGIVLPAERLASGRYVLAVRWVDPVGGETSRRYALEVRVSREP